jgi:hypothetical protein
LAKATTDLFDEKSEYSIGSKETLINSSIEPTTGGVEK